MWLWYHQTTWSDKRKHLVLVLIEFPLWQRVSALRPEGTELRMKTEGCRSLKWCYCSSSLFPLSRPEREKWDGGFPKTRSGKEQQNISTRKLKNVSERRGRGVFETVEQG